MDELSEREKDQTKEKEKSKASSSSSSATARGVRSARMPNEKVSAEMFAEVATERMRRRMSGSGLPGSEPFVSNSPLLSPPQSLTSTSSSHIQRSKKSINIFTPNEYKKMIADEDETEQQEVEKEKRKEREREKEKSKRMDLSSPFMLHYKGDHVVNKTETTAAKEQQKQQQKRTNFLESALAFPALKRATLRKSLAEAVPFGQKDEQPLEQESQNKAYYELCKRNYIILISLIVTLLVILLLLLMYYLYSSFSFSDSKKKKIN